MLFIGGSFDEQIGEKQFHMMRVMGATELDILQTDIGAKFAVYESISSLFSKGVFSEEPKCGKESDYSRWSAKDKTIEECFPNFITELKKETEKKLSKYGIDPKNYEFYADKTRITGIALKSIKKRGSFGKINLEYYANPSFTEEINSPVFYDLEQLKEFSKSIIAECSNEETNKLKKCVESETKKFNTNIEGKTKKETEKGYTKTEQIPSTRTFKFDYTPYYENIFYKSNLNKIKFALSFEHGMHSGYRKYPEYFVMPTISYYAPDNEEETKEYPVYDPNKGLQEPEEFEIKGKLSEYSKKRIEVCFFFDFSLKQKEKENIYYVLKEEPDSKKKFTDLRNKYPNGLTNKERQTILKGEIKNNIVNYYLPKEQTNTQISEYCFYINIPHQTLEESAITIYSEFTTKDANERTEESVNIIIVKFVNEPDIEEEDITEDSEEETEEYVGEELEGESSGGPIDTGSNVDLKTP